MIIQLADPVIIQWIMATAREAAAEAGRDPRSSSASSARRATSPTTSRTRASRSAGSPRWSRTTSWTSSSATATTRRFPHELTEYVRARKFYDYDEHSRVGAKHGEFVTDEICDRFCVLGNAEQATAKLKELEEIGVDQFNIYLMTHGQEDDLAAYGKDIIPQF